MTAPRHQPPRAALSSPDLEAKGWDPQLLEQHDLLAPTLEKGWGLSMIQGDEQTHGENNSPPPPPAFGGGPGLGRSQFLPDLPPICFPTLHILWQDFEPSRFSLDSPRHTQVLCFRISLLQARKRSGVDALFQLNFTFAEQHFKTPLDPTGRSSLCLFFWGGLRTWSSLETEDLPSTR